MRKPYGTLTLMSIKSWTRIESDSSVSPERARAAFLATSGQLTPGGFRNGKERLPVLRNAVIQALGDRRNHELRIAGEAGALTAQISLVEELFLHKLSRARFDGRVAKMRNSHDVTLLFELRCGQPAQVLEPPVAGASRIHRGGKRRVSEPC
jgi:hypothetical protein